MVRFPIRGDYEGGLVNPEEEDSICEAMEQLRINYNLRQWRVCALICDSLADKFKGLAEKEKK